MPGRAAALQARRRTTRRACSLPPSIELAFPPCRHLSHPRHPRARNRSGTLTTDASVGNRAAVEHSP
eukprot:4812900-Prymnesium_polylepis.1